MMSEIIAVTFSGHHGLSFAGVETSFVVALCFDDDVAATGVSINDVVNIGVVCDDDSSLATGVSVKELVVVRLLGALVEELGVVRLLGVVVCVLMSCDGTDLGSK